MSAFISRWRLCDLFLAIFVGITGVFFTSDTTLAWFGGWLCGAGVVAWMTQVRDDMRRALGLLWDETT